MYRNIMQDFPTPESPNRSILNKNSLQRLIDYISNILINANPIDISDFIFVYSKRVKSIVKPYHLCRNTNY